MASDEIDKSQKTPAIYPDEPDQPEPLENTEGGISKSAMSYISRRMPNPSETKLTEVPRYGPGHANIPTQQGRPSIKRTQRPKGPETLPEMPETDNPA